MPVLCRWARFWGLALILSTFPVATQADEPVVEFNRDVRPILSEYCFACHGPDARQREAGLRFDDQTAAFSELPSGNRALVAGNPDESDLIFRVEVDDPELVMPPPKTGKHLSAEQIATLRRWVAQGARWESHWSLTPIKRPIPPSISAEEFSRNPIDAFILRKLEANGLPHAPEADRVTLIRRLSLDLTGLPPTPEEVDRFVSDTDPLAYEHVVDRLLASPRFGERMAMLWLDLVRYADSVGYHGDQPISVSPFRDYVIRSFNDNKPFDQFTIEQVAGDLLPDPTLEQRVAAGYNRLGMMSAEGGVQPREYLAKYAAERVRNIGGAWLGVTLGCCECHDHKYDPFLTRDFYRMEAFFADIQEKGLYSGSNFGPMMPVPSPDQAAQQERLDAEIARVQAELDAPHPELESEQAEWEADALESVDWTPLQAIEVKAKNGTTLAIQADGSILASGTRPASETYTILMKGAPEGVTALKLEVLPGDTLPHRGPGRADNGNFVLSEFSVSVHRETDQSIPLTAASATFEQSQGADKLPGKSYSASHAIDGENNGLRGWAILGAEGKESAAVFETSKTVSGGPETLWTFTLVHGSPFAGHNIGRFRLWATDSPRPVKAQGSGLPDPVRQVLAVAKDERNEEQRQVLAAYYRSIAPALASIRDKRAALEKRKADLTASIPTMVQTNHVEPRPIRVLARGNWMDDSGEVVEPGVPAVLPQPEVSDRRLTRLDLARWLVSSQNPLTARALVNRLWKLTFGEGLSRKLDDLGSQGEWPSHPELLDWLSGQLIDSGWDIKATLRLIVLSGVYRQSSAASAEVLAADPTNRWLARQGRFRLDAELIRDTALSIAGLLVEEQGGPSVKPYQPPGYWSFLNFPKREWQNDSSSSVYRRGLYIHWQRQYLYPSLMAFDAPSREECTAERGRSNTPLQALVLLNDPVYVEAARSLAERILLEGDGTASERIDFAMKLARSRPARPEERSVLEALLQKHLDEYQSDPKAAEALLSVGQKPRATGLDPAELAAWTDLARVILNLHAVISRS